MSPFNWRQDARPSIFCGDPAFAPTSRGKTRGQSSSAGASKAVKRRTAETGVSPGYVPGLTKAERLANRELAWARPSGV